jgi:hypothetical protein
MLAHCAYDGGKKASVTEESAKETVKTIARGMPGEPAVLVVTTLVCFFILHAGPRALAKRPAFPAPSDSEGGRLTAKTRAKGAARSRGCGCGCLKN